jgi:RNA polymerase sigma factor (sigma-70 family)
LLFGIQIITYALPVVIIKPGGMTTDTDNPCQNIEQGSLEFYQALLADYKQAWECLYVSAFRSFVPYARQRSAISTDDALDILQEGMAEFALKLKSRKYVFQGRPVAAYVFTVCRNRWVSFLRRNHIQKVDITQDTATEESDLLDDSESSRSSLSLLIQGDTDQDGENEAGSSNRDAIWEDNEVDWEAVGRAFSEVSDDCRTMLHCFYVDEKSLSECGAKIGLQENSAKVKRFRCAQRLKALYIQYKIE